MTYPGGTKVLVWRLEEDASQLLALCQQQGILVEDMQELPVKRQREKAAEQLLLCAAFGHPVTLLHTSQGAPYVKDIDVNISITHTMRLVALAWNEDHVIGLDAEQMDRKQVIRVRDKYLNASEQQFVPLDDLPAHIIAWTAKEAIIKATRNSAIDWTDGIRLEPFVPNPEETLFFAHCDNQRYRLTARIVEEHYLTVADCL